MESNETRLALNIILSTAASMGVDVGLLCHAACDELLDGDLPAQERILAPAAVFVIGVALGAIVDPSH